MDKNQQKVTAAEILEQRRAWAAAEPAAPVWPGGPTRDEYVAGFVRKTGSYVREVTSMTSLQEFFDRIGELTPIDGGELPAGCNDPDCRYFEGAVPPGYTAVAAAALSSSMTTERLSQVKVVEGPHGLEFQLDLPGQRTGTIKFVVDGEGLRTWYPGEFLPPNPTAVTVKFTRGGV